MTEERDFPQGPPSDKPAAIFFPTTLTIAQESDLKYVIALQKKHTGELGFLPAGALSAYVQMSQLLIAHENDEPCGYVVGRKQLRYDPRIAPITQACIQFDAQRRHHGFALVCRVCTDAILRHQELVQCWCAADIEANSFWEAAGFTEICEEERGNTRKRKLKLWRKPLKGSLLPWMREPPPRAGHKAKTTANRTLSTPEPQMELGFPAPSPSTRYF